MDVAMNETGSIANIADQIYKRFHFEQDPMLLDMPLMSSPLPTIVILALYIISVKILGPPLMENRKAINPKQWIRVYNIAQIIINVLLFCFAMKEVFLTNNTLTCLRNDRTSAMLTYFFYLNKLSDLTETYFFLVKKSWRQISYLHVYHHIMVISCIYADIYLQPGGQVLYLIIFNTYVHACMYTYYLLSSWKPNMKFLEIFKPMVTQVQLFQFVLGLLAYGGTLLFSDCAGRKHWFLLVQGIIQYSYMIYMFGKFYLKNYLLTEKKVK